MARNGHRRPPRPRIAGISGAPSATEAAAVVAAIEQFLADTAPAPAPPEPAMGGWARAGLEEAVAARQVSGYAWGHAPRR